MLADSINFGSYAGRIGKELNLSASFRKQLLKFIAAQLPRWRDRSRNKDTAENSLTSGLSAHLTSAARLSGGWDSIQFRAEIPDERKPGRTIDLAPSPCGAVIWIEGRRYSDMDMLFPIECKRLPTPVGSDRDAREYVISTKKTTGGIQRFKAGHHGANHNFGAMIAYIQKGNADDWHGHISQWIDELAIAGVAGWSSGDHLHPSAEAHASEVILYQSTHSRSGDLADMELHHLWIQMSQQLKS